MESSIDFEYFLIRCIKYVAKQHYIAYSRNVGNADLFMDNLAHLQNLGLSMKEARIYVACLELGTSSAVAIAKRSGVPKSTVYDSLESLKKQGYFVMAPRGGKKYYSVSDPAIFETKVRVQEESLIEVLPELKALYGTDTKRPRVRYFESDDALEIINREVLGEATELLAIASQDDAEVRFAEFFRRKSPVLRLKKKLPLRIIFRDSELAREYKADDKKYLRQSKLIPKDTEFSAAVWIWKNKVATFSYRKKFTATVIEDPEVYQVHKALFESMWNYHPEVK